MISKEMNDRLMKVGPGTPAGDMMRRYWWPVAMAEDVQERPALIRVLGEDLVLFRDGDGQLGLIDSVCAHRCANLALGRVEADGLRCAYHGWKFDTQGRVIEVPGHPDPQKVAAKVNHTAYHVVEHEGLIFAYLGPDPVPLLPQYDFVVGEGDRAVDFLGVSEGSWMRWVEGGVDPNHVAFLHGEVGGLEDCATVPDKIKFVSTDYGLCHQSWRPGMDSGTTFYREHHHVFPTMGVTGAGQRRVQGGNATPSAVGVGWFTPIDDNSVLIFYCVYKPAENTGTIIANPPNYKGDGFRLTPMRMTPYLEYRNGERRTFGYEMPPGVLAQDSAMAETIADVSEREFLIPGDEGITRARRMVLKAIEDVAAGRDPIGVFREPQVIRVPARELVLDSEKELIPV
jgi:phenylpropionate dioxygenase-like ring-hydroxylating dioxygenase large terminal subunit